MEDKTLLALGAMLCIFGLETMALYMKIDGQILSVVIGVIAGLGGYVVGKVRSET